MSRFVGSYLGGFALATVFLTAIASSVTLQSSIWRGFIAFVVFTIIGRIIGFAVGRQLEQPPKQKTAAPPKQAEAAS